MHDKIINLLIVLNIRKKGRKQSGEYQIENEQKNDGSKMLNGKGPKAGRNRR